MSANPNQRIEITVTAEGDVAVETKGFVGRSCKAASAPYEAAVGSKTGERLKPEYHQTMQVGEPERVRA